MQILDNVNKTIREDIAVTVSKGSHLSIAAACFSIYAYQALKKQLDGIAELRFIFTAPAFLSEKAPKTKREFYIPRLDRERSLYGTEFEVKLRNELTQKAIARECADWIRKKATFMANTTDENINTMMNVKTADDTFTYFPFNEFTTSGIGVERGNNATNMVTRFESPMSNEFVQTFEQVWNNKKLLENVTDFVLDGITAAYNENSPEFIYFVAIYNIFNEFLSDISEDILPNEAIGFKESAIWNKLYDFQKDAALSIISKLEQYNGCILADSVGLGKTFTALAVVKYYELRNRSVLVLCPKKLGDNWDTFKEQYLNNPIIADRLRYDVLYHTDLTRAGGKSGNIDLAKLNWSSYDLVVIDESHNFRNGGETYGEDKRENRYLQLLNKVIRKGVKTKVLMLSATPVNNGFSDLRHQLELAYEGNPDLINKKLGTKKSIDTIFRQAQTSFNKWSKLDAEQRTTENLLDSLDFDFFTMLDSVTIARSRKHIEKYYNMEEIGKFPERLPPISLHPELTDLPSAINYEEIYAELMNLNLAVYSPMAFVHESKREKYINDPENKGDVLRITGQESGTRKLMAVNLLKRLESSVNSFRLTLQRIETLINSTIDYIDNYSVGSGDLFTATEINEADFDGDDQNTDYFNYGKKRQINLADMDYVSWRELLAADSEIIALLMLMITDITPEHDTKLQTLLSLITKKIQNPLNAANKKILIFSAFSDTVEYLYREVTPLIKQKFRLDCAMITGSDNKSTAKLQRTDISSILTLFSPLSKDKALLMQDNPVDIDILIATDCISEGQNLQDCDYCVNYDIHWNPVRIIQRFGRIDRIGSLNDYIQLVNFWPDVDLDEYLNLKGRVETRMKASILSATGDDNIIDDSEKGNLEYRRAQLERLQSEVVDIEEMQSDVSIMDLGLNEFRLDLLEYVKHRGDLDNTPFGLHAVVDGGGEDAKGTIFILKNRNANINIKSQNLLHPFYMVYIREDSTVYIDHLQPKRMLDNLRQLCKGKDKPLAELCKQFNADTEDGRNMKHYSDLLGFAVKSIVDIDEESAQESLFKPGGTTALTDSIEGLDDFELVCFITVK
jgi:SNF2 family DNA or RNA helicase